MRVRLTNGVAINVTQHNREWLVQQIIFELGLEN